MNHDAPLVLHMQSLHKDRAAGQAEAYSLRVPELSVRLGEKILITGPSGSGKSTLLDMIGMVLKPDRAGQFLFHPEARKGSGKVCDIAEAWREGAVERLALWRRHVGYVLQTGGLLPFVSVAENIRIPRRLLGLDPNAALADKLVSELRITHLLNKLPAQLSVGERQRVAIARALSADPPLVLADEPTAALDPENAVGVLDMFSRAVAEMGVTLIMVSHAPEQMAGMNFRRLEVRTSRQADGTLAELGEYAGSSGNLPGDNTPEIQAQEAHP